jgi:CDP-diacylglycerol--glycerol-3-phosphate 3-phosphatidyltransferase
MLDNRWRSEVEKTIRPIGARLRQSGFTADQITLFGLAASLFTGIAIATGHFVYAAIGMAICGITDVLDGAVAKSGGTAGPRGAFFDSVSDRVSDMLVLGGAAWYYTGVGNSPRLAVLAFAVAGLSVLVSYERSRAESLGFNGKGGLMERAERMVLLGVGLAFGWLTATLWLLFVLTGITVGQRFAKVWAQASAPAGEAAPEKRGAAWWITPAAGRSDESRLNRWRTAVSPPGDRGRLTAWWLSTRPPRPEVPSGDGRTGFRGVPERLARWRSSPRPRDGGSSPELRRLRGRNRP